MLIGLVTTGGTVSGALLDDVVRSVERNEAESSQWVHDVASDTELVVRSPLSVMSENMDPSDWVAIAQAVRELVERNGVDGILVLHGTDTMTFTASALSFMCADLDRPIVLTGANLPADSPRSDASANIAGAVVALRRLRHGVYISFAGAQDAPSHVIAATRSRKMHAGGQPYHSIGAPLVGIVDSDGTWTEGPAGTQLATIPSSARIHVGVDHRVALAHLYPGVDFALLRAITERGRIHAIVLQLYASLTAPTRTGRLDCASFSEWATSQGILVVGCPSQPSQMPLSDYESSVQLREAGMVVAPTALPEVAYVKASWLSAATTRPEELRERFMDPVGLEFFGGTVLSDGIS